MGKNSLAGYFSVISGFVFSGGGKERGGREEEERRGTVTHVTRFRAVRWQML